MPNNSLRFCTKARPGDWDDTDEENGDDGGGGGGGGGGTPIDPGGPADPPEPPPPPNGFGPPTFDIPDDTTITIPSPQAGFEDSYPGNSTTSFQANPIVGQEDNTRCYWTDPLTDVNQPKGTIPLTPVGSFVDSFPGTVEAELSNLCQGTVAEVNLCQPEISVVIYGTQEDFEWIQNNDLSLYSLSITGMYNFVYDLVFDTHTAEYTRFEGSLAIPISVVYDDGGGTGEIDPNIGWDSITIKSNTGETTGSVVTEPTSWDLGTTTIISWAFSFANPTDYPVPGITLDTLFGYINTEDVQDQLMLPPEDVTLTVEYANGNTEQITILINNDIGTGGSTGGGTTTQVGDAAGAGPATQICLIDSDCPDGYICVDGVCVLDDDPGPGGGEGQSPVYPTTDIEILYNDSTGGSVSLLPTLWPEGTYIGHLDVYGPPTYGDPEITYGWSQFSLDGVTSNNDTGEITFSNIPVEWNVEPTQVQIIAYSPDGQTDVTINIVTSEADDGGGGEPDPCEGVVCPPGQVCDNGICVPIEFFTNGGGPGEAGRSSKMILPKNKQKLGATSIKATPRNMTSPITSVKTSGRYYHSIRQVPFTPEVLETRYLLAGYTNGVTYPAFSFFQTTDYAEDVTVKYASNLDHSTTGVAPKKSVFANNVDFTIKEIKGINNDGANYSDFAYKALSDHKVIRSLDHKVRSTLASMLDVDGKPLLPRFAKNIKNALIRGEDDQISVEDITALTTEKLNSVRLATSNNKALNYSNAITTLLANAKPLDPDLYKTELRKRNQLFNWRVLAEEINKRVIYKKSDGTSTPQYLPNAETLTVKTSDGTEHTLDMQDGDYFDANPVTGSNRLTVFSDISKAKSITTADRAQAYAAFGKQYTITLDCSSDTSSLVELNVDTTAARQDYYFLKLDKNSITKEDEGSIFLRKMSGEYDYETDVDNINTFVKHKAFPYLLVYLRNDDMLFNHLESGKRAKVTLSDISLDNFSNAPDVIFPFWMPWHIMIIPSDRSRNIISHQTSRLDNFNKRSVDIGYLPILTDTGRGMKNHFYLTESVTTTESINFKPDVVGNIVYEEGRKYSLNTTGLEAVNKYKNSVEVLPRKLSPTGKLLQEVSAIKVNNSLGSRDSVSVYDVFSRLEPKVFRSLHLDQVDINKFKGRLRRNMVTEDDDINKTYFVPVKELSNINNKPPVLIPSTPENPVIVNIQSVVAGEEAEAVPAPEDRPGGPTPTP